MVNEGLANEAKGSMQIVSVAATTKINADDACDGDSDDDEGDAAHCDDS